MRKHERIPVKIPARLVLKTRSKSFDGEILNLSEGGAFVASSETVMAGEEILLEIRFSEARTLNSIVVQNEVFNPEEAKFEEVFRLGVVRWNNESGASGFGVEFTENSEDQKQFLRKVLAYFEQLAKAGVSL